MTLKTGQIVQGKEMGVRLKLLLTLQPFNRTTSTPNGLAFISCGKKYLVLFDNISNNGDFVATYWNNLRKCFPYSLAFTFQISL